MVSCVDIGLWNGEGGRLGTDYDYTIPFFVRTKYLTAETELHREGHLVSPCAVIRAHVSIRIHMIAAVGTT